MAKIKKIVSCGFFMAIFSAFCCITASAQGVCNLNVSPKNAGVGEEINVVIEFTNDTLDVLSAKATLEYDSSVIEVSESSEIQGAGGVIALSDLAGDAPSVEFKVTFVAKNVGSCDIMVTNGSVTNTDGDISVVDSVSEQVEVSQEGGFNSESKLKAFEFSAGTISKEFSAEVTSYTIDVEYEVESIEFKAQMNSVKSYIYFSGFSENDISFVEGSSPRIYEAKSLLSVGDNVKKITVEAENGEETVYTINVVRHEKDEIVPINPDSSESNSSVDDSEANMNIFQTKPSTTTSDTSANSPKNDSVLGKIFPVVIGIVFVIAIGLVIVVFVARFNDEKQSKKRRRPVQGSQSTRSRNSTSSSSRTSEARTQQPKKAVVKKKSNNSSVRRPK